MDSLELKVPPPVVALVAGVLMWLGSLLVAPFPVPFAVRVTVAMAIAGAGVAVNVAAILSFRRARTTLNPTQPAAASSLIVGGVFRFSRNPIYVSLLLYLVAWAVYLCNGAALILLPVFVWYMNRFQIRPEENALSSVFGREYVKYMEKVRRWV